MSQENIEVIRRIYAAWARNELPGPAGTLDPDFEYVNPGGARANRERDADWWPFATPQRRCSGWALWRMESEEFTAVGDQVAVVVGYRPRGRTSGVEVEGRESALWTLRDGKVVRYEWFHQPDEALEAVRQRE